MTLSDGYFVMCSKRQFELTNMTEFVTYVSLQAMSQVTCDRKCQFYVISAVLS